MIVFTDLRLMNEKDVKNKEFYPIETYNCRLKRKICNACKIFFAKFFVIFLECLL
jgi:hypothetical protein